MLFVFGTTITVIRLTPGGTDVYGDAVTSTSSSTTITGCAVAPRYSTEPAERGRQGVIVGLTLYAPTGSDILHTDTITIDGVSYVIEGEPAEWHQPMTGWDPGIEVALKRVLG